jgi:tRNA(fMet)-specific endonuclease VapC
VRGKLLAVSFVTVGEILFGAYKKKWGTKKLGSMKESLKQALIVPYDWEVCQQYGTLKVRLQEKGLIVADNDLWIAACAVRHDIPLLTNNKKHFEKIPELVVMDESRIIAEIQSQQKIDFEAAKKSKSGSGEPPTSR